MVEQEQPKELTKEQQEEMQERVKGFNADYVAIVEKWKLVWGSRAILTPDGRISSMSALIDTKYNQPPKTEEPEAKVTEG